jgi:hypothetical protein
MGYFTPPSNACRPNDWFMSFSTNDHVGQMPVGQMLVGQMPVGPNAHRPNARRPNARRPNARRPNACRPNDKFIAVSTKHHFDQMPVGQMTGLWLCRRNVTLVKCLSARCLSTKRNVAFKGGQNDVPVSLCEPRRLRRPICLQPQSPVFKVVKLFFYFVSNVAAKVS